jgi:3-oxoacyl-[acyl-carrier protein] reductase
MDTGLRDRVAIVAGGTRGLGYAVAHALLTEGARVSICGRGRSGVTAAVARLAASHPDGHVDGRVVDVRHDDDVRAWVDGTAERHGRLDVVIANAGGPPGGEASEHGLEDYREALELNLLSSVRLVQASLPHLRAGAWGRLIFITSVTVKQPMPGLALSNTSRPGVVGYARSLVQELGPGAITVNVLAPGITRTDRLLEFVDTPEAAEALAADVPLGRLGRPEEFAAAAVFLASAAASYITGVVLPVDGGLVRSLL